MSYPRISDSQGLLSRLGQWFKSGPEADALGSPDALIIRHKRLVADDLSGRERHKRKLRVDQIRKAEFAELRSMLSKVTTSVESSHLSSSTHTHSPAQRRHVQAETRGKIDSIEEQMSKDWYASSQSSATGGSTQNINEGAENGASPASAQRIMRTLVGDQLVDFAYPPEAVNAAIAYAIGDYISAERILTGICTRRDRTDRLLTSWELRFELYLSINKKAEFEDAAIDFAAKFGKSPPIWLKAWKAPAPVAAQNSHSNAPSPSSGFGSTPQALKLQPDLDLNGMRALLRQFSQAKNMGVMRVDWASVQTLSHEAMAPLLSLFQHLPTWPGRLEWRGSDHLAHLLAQQTQQPSKDNDQRTRWLLLLLYWQITGNEVAFDTASIDYCLSQEESAPTWVPPLCEFTVPSLETAKPSLHDEASFEPTRLVLDEPPDLSSGRVWVDKTSHQVALKDTLKGDIRKGIANLPVPAPNQRILFDCTELLRIDAQAASHLLAYLRQHQVSGGHIHLHGMHRLVSIYLFSLGLPPHVTLSLITL